MAEENNSILGSNTVLTSQAAHPEKAYFDAKEACALEIDIAQERLAKETDPQRKEELNAYIETLNLADVKMDELKARDINDAFVYRGFAQLNWDHYAKQLDQLNHSLEQNPVLPPSGSEERANEIQSRMVLLEDNVQINEKLDQTNRSPEVTASVAPAATLTNWDLAYAATLREREAALAVPETAENHAQSLETVSYTDGVLSDLDYLRDQGFSSFVGFVTNKDGSVDVPTFTAARKRLVAMAASPGMDALRNNPAAADPYIATQIGVPLPGTAPAQETTPAEPSLEMGKQEEPQKDRLAQFKLAVTAFSADFFAAFILRKQARVAAKEAAKQAAFFEDMKQRKEAREAARAAKADQEPIELTNLVEEGSESKPTENLAAPPQNETQPAEQTVATEATAETVAPLSRNARRKLAKQNNKLAKQNNKLKGKGKAKVAKADVASTESDPAKSVPADPAEAAPLTMTPTGTPVTMPKKASMVDKFIAGAKVVGRHMWQNRAEIGVGFVTGLGLRLGSRYLMGLTGATALPWILASTAGIGAIVGGVRGYMRVRKMRKDGTIEKGEDGHEYILGKVKNEEGKLVDGMVRFSAKKFVISRAILGGVVSLAVGALGVAAADALSNTEFGGWLRECFASKNVQGMNSITDKPSGLAEKTIFSESSITDKPAGVSAEQAKSIFSLDGSPDEPNQCLAPEPAADKSIFSASSITDKPAGVPADQMNSIYSSNTPMDTPAQKLAMADPMGGDKSIHDGVKSIHNGEKSIHDGMKSIHDGSSTSSDSTHSITDMAHMSVGQATGLSPAQIDDLRAHGIEIPKNTKSPAAMARFLKDASHYYQYKAPVRDIGLGSRLIDQGVELVEKHGLMNGHSGKVARMLYADQAYDRMYRTHDYPGAAESAKKAGNIRGGWAKKLLGDPHLKGLDSAAKADALAKQIVGASQADAVTPQGVPPVAPVQPAAPAAASPMGAAAADSASLEAQGLPLIRPPASSPLGAAVSHGAATVEAHKLPLITPPAAAQTVVPPATTVPDVMPQSVSAPVEPRVQVGTSAADSVPPVQGGGAVTTKPELPPEGAAPVTKEPELQTAPHTDTMASRGSRRSFGPKLGMA